MAVLQANGPRSLLAGGSGFGARFRITAGSCLLFYHLALRRGWYPLYETMRGQHAAVAGWEDATGDKNGRIRRRNLRHAVWYTSLPAWAGNEAVAYRSVWETLIHSGKPSEIVRFSSFGI